MSNVIEINLNVKQGNATATVTAVRRQLEQLGRTGNDAGRQASAGMHGTVSSVQAASAALRDLQGDWTHNLRAVEKFVTLVPGVSGALKAAFPLVGGLAFGAMLGTMASKLVDFNEKVRDAPRNIKDGFDSLAVSGQLANDQLDLTNVKLENQIAKLEHKPQNAVAQALAEATVQADKFAESLDGAYNKEKSLLSENRIGAGMSVYSGQGATTNLEGTTNSYNRDLANLQNQIANATSDDNQPLVASLQKQFKDKENAARAAYQKSLDEFKGAESQGFFGSMFGLKNTDNEQGNIDIAQANLRGLDQIDRGQKLQSTNDADNKKHDSVQAAKDLAEEQREDARKAAEAKKAAQEAQMQGFEAGLAALKSAHQVSVAEEYEYWENLTKTAGIGVKNLLSVTAKAGEAYQQVLKENDAALQESGKTAGGFQPQIHSFSGALVQPLEQAQIQPEDLTKDSDTERGLAQDAEATKANLSSLNESIAATTAQGDAIREAAIEQGTALGSLSRYDAAMQLQTLHTAEYTKAHNDLAAAIAEAQKPQAGVSSNEQAARVHGLQQQSQNLDDARALQSPVDEVNVASNDLTTAIDTSLDRFVQKAKDGASAIGDSLTNAIDGINDTLATVATTRYHTSHERNLALRDGLAGTARGEASKLTKYGLNKAEGGLLGAAGFGNDKTKKDGSSEGAALWVQIVGGLTSAGKDAGTAGSNAIGGIDKASGGLLSKMPGGHFVTSMLSKIPGVPASLRPTLQTGGADPLGLNTPLLNTTGGADPLGLNNAPLVDAGLLDTSASTTDVASSLGTGLADTTKVASSLGLPLLSGVLKGFASGGSVSSNVPIIVGENGPEVFNPGSNGSIIPNNQLGGSSGDVHHHHNYNIDAKGANEATVRAQVMKGIRDAAPSIMAGTISAQKEHNLRKPSSRRS